MSWPPQITELDYKPMQLPYLDSIPDVVELLPGRQLFVDDYLLESTTLKRVLHVPEPMGPAVTPEHPWEGRMADAFSGGCWFDPQDGLYKLWYSVTTSEYRNGLCYAESADGSTWTKPSLDTAEAGTNLVLRTIFDSTTIWLDHHDVPERRYKYFATERCGGWNLTFRVSRDGKRWSEPLASSPVYGDRTTVFHNPFREKWVASIRIDSPKSGEAKSAPFERSDHWRARAYLEADTPEELIENAPRENLGRAEISTWGDAVLWYAADELDPHNPAAEYASIDPALYTLDATPYESVLVGLFSIWQGPENDVCYETRRHKRNDILVGFTRDGFHWDRPSRTRFISCSDRARDYRGRNVQSAGGGFLVVEDELHFYASGWTQERPGTSCTWRSTMRRDGFTSLEGSGVVQTRLIRATGSHLFVNVATHREPFTAEILDESGKVIEPYSRENCTRVTGDHTRVEIQWRNISLTPLAGRPIRIRFHLDRGAFYSFWLTDDADGASGGYVAAGGPGLTRGVDCGKR